MGRYFQLEIWLFYVLFIITFSTESAVVAPPWANPKLNPCATQPRGWQLLYWPPDGKCYKIFQMGYPCPEGMELSPAVGKSDKNLSAECRCPPKTAQSAADEKCYELFTLGPCEVGYYFGPDSYYKNEISKRQWGSCKQIKACANDSFLYWPQDGTCYKILTRGPCSKGQLFMIEPNTGIPICSCGEQTQLQDYQHHDGYCYQHFTRGPCWEKGHLFLPDKTCGCFKYMPHYHEDTKQCYELGTKGPCDTGQVYTLNPGNGHAECSCKTAYIQYQNSSICYRLFTQGPCPQNYILSDTSTCLKQPCQHGYLYYPYDKTCYRIGSQGPCSVNKIFTFDFTTRPSVDGISYNGMCRCEKINCDPKLSNELICDKVKGLIKYNNQCHKMYTQGPCFRGSWLVPQREGKQELFSQGKRERVGICECIPGYVKSDRMIGQKNITLCLSPAMVAADYMNKNYTTAQVTPVSF